jgi:hypothetical protein
MTTRTRRKLYIIALAIATAAALSNSRGRASGLPQSFTFLQDGFTQQLIGRTNELLTGDIDGDEVPDGILGGVAFAGDGDPIVAECEFQNTRLHRFDLQAPPVVEHETDLAPETIMPGHGGCGLVNHPNGSLFVAMNDGMSGVANISRDTGALLGFFGPPSNGLGIAVDPQTNDVIYASEDCRFTPEHCSFIRLDPENGETSLFGQIDATEIEFVDGMYFDPSGTYLFMATRSPILALTIMNRMGQVVRHVPMDSEPDGVAFHEQSPKFVVTNNTDGTMTRFDFPADDYSQMPTVSPFAAGGYRGDLSQVGADGCIYLTQKGARYNDGTATEPVDPTNSVVRICSEDMVGNTGGGFAPPPGTSIEEELPPPPLPLPASVGGTVYHDVNKNGARDSGEPGISGVVVTLDGSAAATTTTAPDGTYAFTTLMAGPYSVAAPDTAAGKGRLSPSPVSLALIEGENRTDVDFGYVTGSISGYAYVDANGNGSFDGGEVGLGGVPIAMGSSTATTDPNGAYTFGGLDAAGYSVVGASTASGYNLSTSSPLSVTLAAAQNVTGVNFGYANGMISGYAYIDANGNGMMDSGEAGIGNVTIGLSGSSTASTTTNANGSYFFNALLAGSYSVAAPSTAGGRPRTTPSPLAVSLTVGATVPNMNFGYRIMPYRTQTQGGWGATPHGNNPAVLLANNFAAVYPSGVTIGGTKTLTFTSAAAVGNFLPAGGKAGALTASAVNPTSSSAGVFAGQVLALRLSVDFSNAGVTTSGLSALKIAPGKPLAGSTVAQVLAWANTLLGGGTAGVPAGVTIATLNTVVSSINENFDNGTTNNGFLVQ